MAAGVTTAEGSNLLKLLFNNTTWANVGDATGIVGSTGAGSFYISLHTADPGVGGTQSTSEATYTGYARVAVARTTGGFTVSSLTVSNAAAVTFGADTATANTITYFGIGTASSGTGHLLMRGTCSLSVDVGITPTFAIGTLTASVS